MAGVPPPLLQFSNCTSPLLTVVFPSPTPLRGWLAFLHFLWRVTQAAELSYAYAILEQKNRGGAGVGVVVPLQKVSHRNYGEHVSKKKVLQFQRGLKRCPMDVPPH